MTGLRDNGEGLRSTPPGSLCAALEPKREPDVEKALTHLSAAAVEAELGMATSGWKAGETPNPAWWAYREAAESIGRAERALTEGRRRGAIQ